tara:strand:+ start:10949 stop:11104 length:156 start_codon:yes stop_codon:yes gene_type:complete
MRKGTSNLENTFKSGARGKKTSIGFGNVGTSTMNKGKKRMRGKSAYRGQGK